ncbi:hypothetical protein E4U40_007496 [Claviceps sp. LM458 group G5]|nr:hypothetical protein E4U40_007496 [Claviceps sp. LM458 group G5]
MVADLSDDNRRVKQSKSSRGEPSRGKPAEESRTSVVMHKRIREVDGIPKVRLDSRLENRMERYATSSGDMARIHQDSFRFALDARGERREAGDEQRSLGLRLLSPGHLLDVVLHAPSLPFADVNHEHEYLPTTRYPPATSADRAIH